MSTTNDYVFNCALFPMSKLTLDTTKSKEELEQEKKEVEELIQDHKNPELDDDEDDWELPLSIMRERELVDHNYVFKRFTFEEKIGNRTVKRYVDRWNKMDPFIEETFKRYATEEGEFEQEFMGVIMDEYKKKFHYYNKYEVYCMTMLVNMLIYVARNRYQDKKRLEARGEPETRPVDLGARMKDYAFGTLPSTFPMYEETPKSDCQGTSSSSGVGMDTSTSSQELSTSDISSTGLAVDENNNILPQDSDAGDC